jgi:uncharacterized protein DUF2304
MTSIEVQAVAVAVGGAVLFVAAVRLTRRGLLSLRYGLGWLGVATVIAGASVVLGLVPPIARALHMTPTGFLLASVSAFMLLLCLQLSISLSGLQQSVRDLSEANALLEARLQEAPTHGPPTARSTRSRR